MGERSPQNPRVLAGSPGRRVAGHVTDQAIPDVRIKKRGYINALKRRPAGGVAVLAISGGT
jgi:hypothetical protein